MHLRFDDCKLASTLYQMFQFRETKDKSYKIKIQEEITNLFDLIVNKKFDVVDKYFYLRSQFIL